jgi:acetate---CoA ligase (ADP-forming)
MKAQEESLTTGDDQDRRSNSLGRLFRPRSIALVGASERSIWSLTAHDNLVRFGFTGRIIPVNPKGGTIHGRPAVTSCREAGEQIDAALMMIPEAGLLDAFDDLREAGVGGAVVLSSGFAETGAAGAAQQAALAAAARKAGIRLLGPNCLGFANFIDSTPMWTMPLRRATPNPTLALVSQSGSIAGQLEQFSYQQRISFTHMVSTGNESDIDVADVVDFFVANSPARVIAIFLEAVRDPGHFAKAVAAAQAAGKPIVVLKVGASETAAKAAQTHTGSLVGNDRVFDALCKRLGMTRVHSLEELIITADIFGRLGPIERPGLALIAQSGGVCEIATDQAEAEGMPLPVLTPTTLTALQESLPPYATPSNPLDVTGAVMLEPQLIVESIATLSEDPNVGLVGYIFDSPLKDDQRGTSRNFMKSIGEGMKASKKPAIMFSHAFTSVNADARALADDFEIIYSGGGLRHVLAAIVRLFRWSSRPSHNEIRAATVPLTGTRPATEREILQHLARFGVAVIPSAIAASAEEAVAAARTMQGPVVLKIASADIPHKTEVGGVALNLSGDDAVGGAYRTILRSVTAARPEARIDGVIISPMRPDGVELFVGMTRDPQWGPAIAVGLGGVFVEVFKDSSLRLLPVSEKEALDMLDELRGKVLLDGFRGAPVVDRAAIAKAIVAIGNAALALGPELVALEVNPLLAWGEGVEALDGLTEWKSDHAHA